MGKKLKSAEDITSTDTKIIKTYWEELECILDNLCYVDLPKDKQPKNYNDLMEEALFVHLEKAIEILKKLGI